MMFLTLAGAVGCSSIKTDSLAAIGRELPDIQAARLGQPLGDDGVEQTHHQLTSADELPSSTQPRDELPSFGAASPRAPLASFGATVKRDVKALPADLWADTKKVYGSPTNLLILGLSYGGSLAIQETGPDDTIERSYRTHRTFEPEVSNIFAITGSPGTHFALAGVLYVAGQQMQNDKTYETSRKLTSALVITGLSTLLGKVATSDRNPDGDWSSFPSGHASSTFALAAVMHEQYGPLAGIPLYALGGLVSIQRLEDHEHYFSDVVFGGVLGLVIGHTVAADKPLELFGGRIIPYADPQMQSTGIAWWKSID
jgi:hypothetical protein